MVPTRKIIKIHHEIKVYHFKAYHFFMHCRRICIFLFCPKQETQGCSPNKVLNELGELEDNTAPQSNSKGTMLELLRYPNMRRKFCILTFLWLANSVAYNGLSYNSANIGVSDTLAFFINAIVEAPAYVLTWWAMVCIIVFYLQKINFSFP